jgi:hypothetical protein
VSYRRFVVSTFVFLGFLGFFFVLGPIALYLFVKLFPTRYPDFIGFPEKPSSDRASANGSGSGETAAD